MDVREKLESEKRLIDANDLKRVLLPITSALENEYGSLVGAVSGVIKHIDSAPTIDAVPVIRCRDCKHHRDKNEQEQQYLVEDILICTSQDATDDCWNAVWPDHFCSYGKRKGCAD